MEMMPEEESVNKLKKILPKGKTFGVSVVQRHLQIGYSRAYRLMEWACVNGHANRDDETKISFR